MMSPINSEAISAALARPGYIPDGITQEYLEESRDQPAAIAILFVTCFVTIIVALRCCARVALVKRFGLDDWLAAITLLPFWAFSALCIVLIYLGSGRHFEYIQYILDNDTINDTQVLDFAAHIIYTTALVICRLSGLAFYARISDRAGKFMYANRAAAAFIIIAYLPQLFLLIFHCLPVTGLWPYGFQEEVNNFTCIPWGAVYVTNSAISVVCDFILMGLPIAIISSLRMTMLEKIKLSFILMPGLLVIAISSTRMYLVVVGQWKADMSWSYNPLLAIEVSEVGSTLLALSIPGLKPLLGTIFENIGRTMIFRSRSEHKNNSGGTAKQGSRGIVELASVLSRNKARNDTPSEENDQSSSKESSQVYTLGEAQYYAQVIHPDRKMSGDSGVSQQPMIRRQVHYSVSRDSVGRG